MLRAPATATVLHNQAAAGHLANTEESLVTVGDKTYGWYSGKEFELPIMQVSTEGGKLVMSVTATTEDGAKVEVTFRGTVEGDRVSGNAEYETRDDAGSFAFAGKLKS